MKNLILIPGILFLLVFWGCQDKKSVVKKIEKKTGLETNSAVSTEVDTLNKKIDKLTDDIK